MKTRYTSLLLVSRLQADLNRIFENALQLGESDVETGDWLPSLDICETDESVLIQIEVPGVRKADLRVRARGDRVTVEGAKSLAPPGRATTRFLCMERSRGRFSRTLQLATTINPRRGSARLADGLLTLLFPKIEDRRELPVDVAIDTDEPQRDDE